MTDTRLDTIAKAAKLYGERSFSWNGINQFNRNPLLGKFTGADGLKTGHTEDGGYGLIGSGMKDGRRVILVLNGMESDRERKMESARLMQWALNGFSNVTLFDDNKTLDDVPVVLGSKRLVGVAAERSVTVSLPKLFEKDLKVEVEYKSPLQAPVTKGDVIGSVKVSVPKGAVHEVPLVAAENVGELSWFLKMIAKARLLSTGEGYLGR